MSARVQHRAAPPSAQQSRPKSRRRQQSRHHAVLLAAPPLRTAALLLRTRVCARRVAGSAARAEMAEVRAVRSTVCMRRDRSHAGLFSDVCALPAPLQHVSEQRLALRAGDPRDGFWRRGLAACGASEEERAALLPHVTALNSESWRASGALPRLHRAAPARALRLLRAGAAEAEAAVAWTAAGRGMCCADGALRHALPPRVAARVAALADDERALAAAVARLRGALPAPLDARMVASRFPELLLTSTSSDGSDVTSSPSTTLLAVLSQLALHLPPAALRGLVAHAWRALGTICGALEHEGEEEAAAGGAAFFAARVARAWRRSGFATLLSDEELEAAAAASGACFDAVVADVCLGSYFLHAHDEDDETTMMHACASVTDDGPV
jgi:hypothetical protein